MPAQAQACAGFFSAACDALKQAPGQTRHIAVQLQAVRRLITNANASLLAAALGFVLGRAEVDVAVMGVTSPKELEEILEAACAPAQPLDWPACALDDARLLTPSLW